jgi:uncharacterized protein YjeT (DUF2065 family)
VADLWAALALILVIERLLLFAVPAAWKQAIARLLTLPDRHLRAIGGAMVIAGMLWIYVLRGPGT